MDVIADIKFKYYVFGLITAYVIATTTNILVPLILNN